MESVCPKTHSLSKIKDPRIKISAEVGRPPEFKHIIKGRKRN
jgi:hypothetical protein